MTIPLTGAASLFVRLGHLANLLYDINNLQLNTIPPQFVEIIGDYTSSDQVLLDSINSQMVQGQNANQGLAGFVQQMSQNVLLRMVYLDTGMNLSLAPALNELIRQMRASNNTVLGYTIGGSVSSANVVNGNGVLVFDTHNASGYVQDLTYAEIIRVSCTQDSTSGASLAGNERFQAVGQSAASGVLNQDYPAGSGCNQRLSAINATANASQGNLLTNSDFETFVANTPASWTIDIGTAGTQVLKETSPVYSGLSSLGIVGDASTLTTISQTLTLSNLTAYTFNLFCRISATPAAGVLRVTLVDENNAVTTDAAGNSNSVSLTLSGVSTSSWQSLTGTFRTPYILPTSLKLQIKLTTALSTGKTLYIDHLALGTATYLYAAGPSIAVFSGSNPLFVPDFFTLTTTNNHTSTNKSFQVFTARTLGGLSNGVLLPSATSGNTISDALIS
jgi:hypothetical protein